MWKPIVLPTIIFILLLIERWTQNRWLTVFSWRSLYYFSVHWIELHLCSTFIVLRCQNLKSSTNHIRVIVIKKKTFKYALTYDVMFIMNADLTWKKRVGYLNSYILKYIFFNHKTFFDIKIIHTLWKFETIHIGAN